LTDIEYRRTLLVAWRLHFGDVEEVEDFPLVTKYQRKLNKTYYSLDSQKSKPYEAMIMSSILNKEQWCSPTRIM